MKQNKGHVTQPCSCQHRYADQEKASSAFSVWGSRPSFWQIPDDSVLYINYWACFHLFLSLLVCVSQPLTEKPHWQGQQKSAVVGSHKKKASQKCTMNSCQTGQNPLCPTALTLCTENWRSCLLLLRLRQAFTKTDRYKFSFIHSAVSLLSPVPLLFFL